MKKLMGRWNCADCGHKRNKGTDPNCANCGKPRNQNLQPTEAFYLPTNAEEVDPDFRAVGPDWNCDKCGEVNRGDSNSCTHCGDPRAKQDLVNPIITYKDGVDATGADFDAPNKVNDDRVGDIVGDPLQEALDTVSGDINKPHKGRVYTLPATALRKSGEVATKTREYHTERKERLSLLEHWGLNLMEIAIAGTVIFLLVIGSVAFWDNFIRTEPKPLTVTALSWERRMEVEKLKTFTENDWSIPPGGREIRSYRAVHHRNKVVDHYDTVVHTNPVRVSDGYTTQRVACGSTVTDNGDGTFDSETTYCDERVEQFHTENHPYTTQEPVYRYDPVYQTKYEYEIDRWVTERWITTSGKAGGVHPTPYYPEETKLQAKERVGDEREETYEVVLEGDGHTYTRNIEPEVWDKLELNEGLVGHITKRGSLRQIDWPTK